MAKRIVWTKSALEDVRQTIIFIARDSKVYADRFTEQARVIAERLDQFSSRGRRVPELERDDVREILFGSYRMIYLLHNNRIYIVAFIHGAMALQVDTITDRLNHE